MKVLVFIEQRDGKIKPSALEAMGVGLRLAGSHSNVAAVIIGKDSQNAASELAGWGADTVFAAQGEGVDTYNVLSYLDAMNEAIKAFTPDVVLGTATPMGRDLFPRLSARLDAGLLTDLTEVEWQNGQIHGTKPMYSGKCLAKVFLQNSKVQLVTIRPNVFHAKKPESGAATVKPLTVSPDSAAGLRTVEIRKGKSERVDLAEASAIISGGRSVGSAENFKILFDCADTIGATVGASRAAVDSGYASHDMQVGQTGKTVNPTLYIACGISGSIQHMAGMRTSKVIVAINTDPDAPIFSVASYGIVGDLFKVVPALTAKLKEMGQH